MLLHHTSYKKPLENLNVVAVDDCKIAKPILQQILYPIGFQSVRIFSDPLDALRDMQRTPADLIISDWVMPIVDGYDFIKRVRHKNNGNSARVPILVFTGSLEINSLCNAIILGVQGFATKPISTSSMLLKCKNIICDSRQFFLDGNYYRLEGTEERLGRIIASSSSSSSSMDVDDGGINPPPEDHSDKGSDLFEI